MDVQTAYLHAYIDAEIYTEQAEGYEKKTRADEKQVYKLQKSLHGPKQSGRNWNATLLTCLVENGFVQNPVNSCVFTRERQNEKVTLIIWVDDLIIAATCERVLNWVKEVLTKMKDMGKLKHFLGIDFEQTDGEVKMSQERYVRKTLKV